MKTLAELFNYEVIHYQSGDLSLIIDINDTFKKYNIEKLIVFFEYELEAYATIGEILRTDSLLEFTLLSVSKLFFDDDGYEESDWADEEREDIKQKIIALFKYSLKESDIIHCLNCNVTNFVNKTGKFV